ncbi:unnamed protein product, partial [Nesidiocoris tenuis]
ASNYGSIVCYLPTNGSHQASFTLEASIRVRWLQDSISLRHLADLRQRARRRGQERRCPQLERREVHLPWTQPSSPPPVHLRQWRASEPRLSGSLFAREVHVRDNRGLGETNSN